MQRFLKSAGVSILGYFLGALVTYFLVQTLSSNTHDRAVEASMTAGLVGGPVFAIFSFFTCLFLIKR